MKQSLYFLMLFFSLSILAQRTTYNNFTGDWNAAGSWTDGQPTTDDEDDNFVINGQITNTVTLLTISGDVTVNDTLIVEGSLNLDENNATLNVGSNGILIVLGDFDFANKLNIDNNGIIAVGGTFDKDGSANQGNFTGSGKVYASSYGSVGGPGNPTTGDWIDDETGNSNQSESVDDLSGDGQSEIEDFINSGGITPLPVDLLYFNASVEKGIKLTWATATEINNDYFSIERSEDGVNFYEIGRVDGNGDSNQKIQYEFEDKFVLAPIEYYRLKQVDYDGQFEYFHVQRVETKLVKEEANIKAYPTNVKNGKISLSSTIPFQVQEIKIYSLSGGETKDLKQNMVQENPLNFNLFLNGIPRGFYLLKMTSSEGKEFSTRIVLE